MLKNHAHHPAEKIYGITTLGEKGQIVIPADAREAMGLKKGQKLLVFGMGGEMVTFAKLSGVEKFATHLSKRLNVIQGIIKKNR